MNTLTQIALAASFTALLAPHALLAQPSANGTKRAQAVVDHWTPARRAAATPRDLVIDATGQGYLRRADGTLEPYGQARAPRLKAAPISPRKRPPDGGGGGGGGGGGDTGDGGGGTGSAGPAISGLTPDGETIGASHTFSTVVTDADGVKSVTFVLTYPNGSTTQSFSASNAGGDTWALQIRGFSDGNWSWHVVAKDFAKRGGNTSTSSAAPFTVVTGGGGSTVGGVTNSQWTGGVVQRAAGRIYFEMPSNPRRSVWGGYVCSGTAIHDGNDADNGDGSDDRSVILTAAHCVYDDANKAFARNVLFIPDQASTTGAGTDLNCGNDPIGCWTPDFGVVDDDWASRTFPQNIEWDYAYYVVGNSGRHLDGRTATADSLEEATGSTLAISFSTPSFDKVDDDSDVTHALGYSYSDDPNFMYCAEDMTTEGSVNWWLPNCGLSGGSSGGPWVQPMDESAGSGPVISLNSWGYTTSPGMAGPNLNTPAAICLRTVTETVWTLTYEAGEAGLIATCD